MGLLLVTVQVRVVEFPTTTLVRVAVTFTSGGTVLEEVTEHYSLCDTVEHITREFFFAEDTTQKLCLQWCKTCLHSVLQMQYNQLHLVPCTCTVMVALLVLSRALCELRPTHVYCPSCAG